MSRPKRKAADRDGNDSDSSDYDAYENSFNSSHTLTDNHQQQFYTIKPNVTKKSRPDLAHVFTESLMSILSPRGKRNAIRNNRPLSSKSNLFINLFDGRESNDDVRKRYELFEEMWSQQNDKISDILNNTNKQLFIHLQQFINETNSVKYNKLPVGFLQLSSNTANNLRILQEFNKFLSSENETHTDYDYKVINISSKNCHNIKATLKELVRQVLNSIESNYYDESEDIKKENKDEEDEDGEDEEDEEEDEEVHQFQGINFGSKLLYDLDMVEEWYTKAYKSKRKLKFVILVQDTNSVSNHVLNQLIKMLYAYRSTLPLKLILGLSSNNISNWINDNFNNEVRVIINGFKFKCNDNKMLGYNILQELFLSQSSNLWLNFKTATIILSRFENSNNSIDSLLAEIKLCYAIHFYSSPLSSLIRYDTSSSLHISGLRKLPSFKRYIERKVYEDDDVSELLKSDKTIQDLLVEKREQFKLYKSDIISLITVIDKLQSLVHFTGRKEQFELYKLLIGNKLSVGSFISDLSKCYSDSVNTNFKSNFYEFRSFMISYDTECSLVLQLRASLNENQATGFSQTLAQFFNSLGKIEPLEEFVFHEVFSMNGGIITHNFQPINEESYENLMINLVRPNLRSSIEGGLDNSSTYLKNPLFYRHLQNNSNKLHPVITLLFRVYKEAPTSINIYDFFMAFKQSLNKKDIIQLVNEHADNNEYISSLDIEHNEEDWNKLAYAWFVQNCQELIMMGLLKEKSKGDHLEKVVWKGV
ncbi:origin recognition complex subunit 3 N-terminus-domain-containing protein [Scheffersomyces amazonensis]|uniref:origin recognition complex subunit 3 N-terminus-domain-containing protein n=1 Tax=Scheffersomyces amazonensis TaxID=1078765 RepID=UPI00315CEC34